MNESEIYWIDQARPARLALTARPRSGEWLVDEVAGWRAAGIDVVVSLLEVPEVRELDLASEESLCMGQGMQYLSFPVADREVPSSLVSTYALAEKLARALRQDQGVVIHCRAGIGRSGLMAACVLLRLGFAYEQVFPLLTQARGLAVPDTAAQEKWVEQFSRYSPVVF